MSSSLAFHAGEGGGEGGHEKGPFGLSSSQIWFSSGPDPSHAEVKKNFPSKSPQILYLKNAVVFCFRRVNLVYFVACNEKPMFGFLAKSR